MAALTDPIDEDAPARRWHHAMTSRIRTHGHLFAFAAAWLLALLGVGATVIIGSFDGLVDASVYWLTGHRPLYLADYVLWARGYSYPPAFAQVIWPATLLPWEIFRVAWLAAAAIAYAWLLAPLRWSIRLPFLLALLIWTSDNLYWGLALVAVIGFRYPSAWALPLLTKITPGVGLAWFAVRGEWRSLMIALGTGGVIAIASFALAPDLWREWVGLMRGQDLSGTGVTNFFVVLPPLPVRVLIALAVVAWGGQTNRPWTVAAAMFLAQPDVSFATFGLLAAIPRLRSAALRQSPDVGGFPLDRLRRVPS